MAGIKNKVQLKTRQERKIVSLTRLFGLNVSTHSSIPYIARDYNFDLVEFDHQIRHRRYTVGSDTKVFFKPDRSPLRHSRGVTSPTRLGETLGVVI